MAGFGGYTNQGFPGPMGMVLYNGKYVNYYSMTEQQKAEARRQYEAAQKSEGVSDYFAAAAEGDPDPAAAARESADTSPDRESAFLAALEDAGVDTTLQLEDAGLESVMRENGIDTDNPEVQRIIQNFPDLLLSDERGPIWMQQLALQYPAPQATAYDDALNLSGFVGTEFPEAQWTDTGMQGAGQKPGLTPQEAVGTPLAKQPNVEVQGDTGWLRFKSGVLVDPDSRQVYYEPNSKAPGSPTWQREVVAKWSPEKVHEWRERLVQYGYLPKEEKKGDVVNTTMMSALVAFHANRYNNGGKPLAGDLAGGAGSASDPKLKPFNLGEYSAQIRNDVREQYRRVYGIDPSDGEVATWTEYIIGQGMALQRQNIKKYDATDTAGAAAEAEERFIEKLEGSPEARFLRDSEEENTRLRDTFSNMAAVTASLTS